MEDKKRKINELEIMKNDLKQNNKNNISVRNSSTRTLISDKDKDNEKKYEE